MDGKQNLVSDNEEQVDLEILMSLKWWYRTGGLSVCHMGIKEWIKEEVLHQQ